MSRLQARVALGKKVVRKRGREQETVCLAKPDGGAPADATRPPNGTSPPDGGRPGSLPLQVHLDNPTGTTPDDAAVLVAVILDCSRAVAQRVLDRAGGMGVLGRFSTDALAERTGIALSQAQRLVAALQLGHRGLLAQTAPRVSFPSPESVASWLHPRVAGLAHEELWLLSLDTQHRLLGACRISQGGSSSTASAIPIILRRALEMGGSYMLLGHNHPGGDAAASAEDIAMTAHIFHAALAVRLTLSDHIIVSGQGFLSMRTERLLPERGMPAIDALCPEGDYSDPVDWIAVME